MDRARGDAAARATRSLRPALRVLLNRWRQWDWIAAQHVDRYVANSHLTAARVKRYFGRESTVLHPPVETARFRPATALGEHYMVLAELMAHKRIDVAVRAFNALGLPLLVVGDGPELRALKRIAGPTIGFTGRVSDERVAELLERARALVVTATEEFGIAAVEALAAGRPVIALDEGGVRESVRDGVTGAFFAPCEPEALVEVVAAVRPRVASIPRPAGPRPSGSAPTASARSWRGSSTRRSRRERQARDAERGVAAGVSRAYRGGAVCNERARRFVTKAHRTIL